MTVWPWPSGIRHRDRIVARHRHRRGDQAGPRRAAGAAAPAGAARPRTRGGPHRARGRLSGRDPGGALRRTVAGRVASRPGPAAHARPDGARPGRADRGGRRLHRTAQGAGARAVDARGQPGPADGRSTAARPWRGAGSRRIARRGTGGTRGRRRPADPGRDGAAPGRRAVRARRPRRTDADRERPANPAQCGGIHCGVRAPRADQRGRRAGDRALLCGAAAAAPVPRRRGQRRGGGPCPDRLGHRRAGRTRGADRWRCRSLRRRRADHGRPVALVDQRGRRRDAASGGGWASRWSRPPPRSW